MTDLLLTPTNPVSSHYDLRPLTPKGASFLNDQYRFRRYVSTGRDMRNFKEACARMDLTHKVDWSVALEAKE